MVQCWSLDVGDSSSGRTADSESVCRGSNPRSPAWHSALVTFIKALLFVLLFIPRRGRCDCNQSLLSNLIPRRSHRVRRAFRFRKFIFFDLLQRVLSLRTFFVKQSHFSRIILHGPRSAISLYIILYEPRGAMSLFIMPIPEQLPGPRS